MMISNIEMVVLPMRICTVWRFATRKHNIESYLVRRETRDSTKKTKTDVGDGDDDGIRTHRNAHTHEK